jgi:hypothetical protein
VYGRVSRYKMDEFLQLFDFPSPSQSAEQRFATNVPLQRLFFMNSDFMQQHAEKIAELVAAEPDDGARIEKVYRLLFGRAPTAEEAKAARAFLQAEALKQYEDRKAEAKMATAKPAEAASAAPPAADGTETAPPPADGMMAGVSPGVKPAEDEKKKMLPVTAFGRYVKVLLSSNEFLFVS